MKYNNGSNLNIFAPTIPRLVPCYESPFASQPRIGMGFKRQCIQPSASFTPISTPIPRFPVEIHGIIASFCPTASLLALSLTSDTLNHLSIPYLYKDIHLISSARLMQCFTTLEADERKRKYVKALRVDEMEYEDALKFFGGEQDWWLTPVMESLTGLTNLSFGFSFGACMHQISGRKAYSFLPTSTTFRLKSFTLENPAVSPHLISFLQSQPSITHLYIGFDPSVESRPLSPTSSFLPSLEHISAQESIVLSVVPFRPLTSVTVLSPLSSVDATLCSIKQSTKVVKTLGLHVGFVDDGSHEEVLRDVGIILPDVEELDIFYDSGSRIYFMPQNTKQTGPLSSFRALRKLRLAYTAATCHLFTSDFRTLVRRLQNGCASLKEIIMETDISSIDWNEEIDRIWRKDEAEADLRRLRRQRRAA